MADSGRFLGVPGVWPAPSTPDQGWPTPDAGDDGDRSGDEADWSGDLAAVGGGWSSEGATLPAPPLRRVPLPPATFVRLPAPPLIRVTPLVAQSMAGTGDPVLDPDDVFDAWAYRDRWRRLVPTAAEPDAHRDGADAAAEPEWLTARRAINAGPGTPDGVSATRDPAAGGDTPDRDRDISTPGDSGRWLGGERLPSGVWLLRDRVPPGSHTTIDQVLVASSGVWVVAIETGSRVELQHDRRRSAERRLLVGGKDRTERATAIGLAAHQVRKIAARHDVPIHSAVCVVGGDRSLLATAVRLHGVWISGPRRLLDMVQQPGALDERDTEIVADLLGARLRER